MTREDIIKAILSFQDEATTKIEKYICKHKLVVMSNGWRCPEEYQAVESKFDCKAYLRKYRHDFDANSPNAKYVCLDLLKHSDSRYLAYSLVSQKEIDKFEKEDWPKLIEPFRENNDKISLKNELKKLHDKEDELKLKIRELETKLAR